ncbi:MAG: hypothetical protein KAS15_08075 [Nanoarchaeota archaeon]|nr:hypothetical protein [Nanoarchaeota archaeon]
MRNKKGQMEIFGLVIIVMLITLGMFIVIRFVVFSEEEETLKGYTQTQSAANFLSTLRRTTTDCNEMSIEQLIQTCAVNPFKTCPDGSKICPYLEEQVEYLLENTLVAWGNKSFYFKADIPAYDINITNKDCTRDDPGNLRQEFIPTQMGIITTELKICDK